MAAAGKGAWLKSPTVRRKGCDLVAIVAGEPRPIRKGHVTILCPSVPSSFVIVPDEVADAALQEGRLTEA